MAGRIQGITVEIGGDTTKLSKALQGVNKDIKSTQTQLKDVEKLLKLDPSNTELVRQKQQLLAQAIKDTDVAKQMGFATLTLMGGANTLPQALMEYENGCLHL